MDVDRSEDLTLARRVAEGEESALETWYERYADPLHAFIYHHLDNSPTDVEEVWQDTLLAALQALPTFRGQSRLFTWLCGIARHKIADHERRRGHRPVEALSTVSPARLAALVDEGPLPEEVLMQRATRAHVLVTLAVLPEDYRQALVARYADGLGVDEVAHRFGRTYKATESLLSRARSAFRVALLRLEGEEGNGRRYDVERKPGALSGR